MLVCGPQSLCYRHTSSTLHSLRVGNSKQIPSEFRPVNTARDSCLKKMGMRVIAEVGTVLEWLSRCRRDCTKSTRLTCCSSVTKDARFYFLVWADFFRQSKHWQIAACNVHSSSGRKLWHGTNEHDCTLTCRRLALSSVY
jgi:hypothetical protein